MSHLTHNHLTKVVSLNPAHGKEYLIQHYVIKFISDLEQFCGFLWALWFPPLIKLTAFRMSSTYKNPPIKYMYRHSTSIHLLCKILLNSIKMVKVRFIVLNSTFNKQRFYMEEDKETGKMKIRANQGHSVQVKLLY
jgi:hypothetical protein